MYQAGLWPSLCAYAHCRCSCTSALLNMRGGLHVGSVILAQTCLYHCLWLLFQGRGVFYVWGIFIAL